jgi:hypothetical protein
MTVWIAFALLAGPAFSAEMPAERIAAAIADTKTPACYPVGRGIGGASLGCVSTPYTRVAGAAQDARKSHQPFAEADVTPDMIRPEIDVYAFVRADPRTDSRGAGGGGVVNPVAVVIAPRGSNDPANVIQPTGTKPVASAYKGGFGGVFSGRALVAMFAPAAIAAGNEIRFVFDGPACIGFASKTECVVKIEPDKMR